MSNIHCGECGAMLGHLHKVDCPKMTQVLRREEAPLSDLAERGPFEDYIRRQSACTNLARHPNKGAYRTITVERAWRLWQAARTALSGKEQA